MDGCHAARTVVIRSDSTWMGLPPPSRCPSQHHRELAGGPLICRKMRKETGGGRIYESRERGDISTIHTYRDNGDKSRPPGRTAAGRLLGRCQRASTPLGELPEDSQPCDLFDVIDGVILAEVALGPERDVYLAKTAELREIFAPCSTSPTAARDLAATLLPVSLRQRVSASARAAALAPSGRASQRSMRGASTQEVLGGNWGHSLMPPLRRDRPKADTDGIAFCCRAAWRSTTLETELSTGIASCV